MRCISFLCYYQELRDERNQNVLSLDRFCHNIEKFRILIDETLVQMTIHFIFEAWQIRQKSQNLMFK